MGNTNVAVLKVYPKINNQFVASYSDLGFQLSTSKNKGMYFKSNENISVDDVGEKINKFMEFARSFGLSVSFDISKVVTTSEKFEGLDYHKTCDLLEESK